VRRLKTELKTSLENTYGLGNIIHADQLKILALKGSNAEVGYALETLL